MRLMEAVRMTQEQYADMRLNAARSKPQAVLERAMGYLARRERDLGPATGDALQILGRAHNLVMAERRGTLKDGVAVGSAQVRRMGERPEQRRGTDRRHDRGRHIPQRGRVVKEGGDSVR